MELDQHSLPTRTRHRYTVEEKLEILQYVQVHSIKAACERYHVSRSSIYEWKERLTQTQVIQAPHYGPTHSTVYGAFQGTQSVCDGGNQLGRSTSEDIDDLSLAHHVQHDLRQRDIDSGRGTNASTGTTTSSGTPFVLVGYHGAANGFAEIAARSGFQKLLSLKAIRCRTFELTGYPHVSDVLESLAEDKIDYACIAHDQLFSNVNHTVLDQIVSLGLEILGEVSSQEHARLCGLPDTQLESADCIISDNMTLQRYEGHIIRLEEHCNTKIHRQVAWDSATACAIVREEHAEKNLTICSEEAASANGLIVIQDTVSTTFRDPRHLIIGRPDTPPFAFEDEPQLLLVTRKKAVRIHAGHRALLDIISAFAYRGVAIESLYVQDTHIDSTRRYYVILYSPSADHNIEGSLQLHLMAAADNVVQLGNYITFQS